MDEALRQLPQYDYIYLADSANAPYGEKSSEWIAARSLALCKHLANKGCDAVVVACNTATAEAIAAIKKHKSAYLMAVGGAAYLVSKAIQSAKVVGFADLGMEAIYEFDVKDMPVTVAVNSEGISMHETGPKEWQSKIAGIPVKII